jgi:hypothetical protein
MKNIIILSQMSTAYRNSEPLPKLEFDKKRFRVKYCPCEKSNKDGKFVPYVGFENKGYCHSCGETFLPELNKDEQWKTTQPKANKPRPAKSTPKSASFIPVDLFKTSLNGYEANNFVQFLINLFGTETAGRLVSRFFIATSKYWDGATIFWQIDMQGNARSGKIMLYSPATGKRVKEPFNHVNWVHAALKLPEFDLKQCFFGEHQLSDRATQTKPVAIVESEKTAIIASGYLPQFIWLAAGSLTGLNAEKCSILKGRTVALFPDLNGFDNWSSKAKELSHLANFSVSDLLERKATEAERKKGFDLADFLLRYNVRDFAIPEPEAPEPPPTVQPLVEIQTIEQHEPLPDFIEPSPPKGEQLRPLNWEQDIIELENYFTSIALPTQPVPINRGVTIIDCSLFIESHIATLKKKNGNRTFLPYLSQLQELKRVLTTNSY